MNFSKRIAVRIGIAVVPALASVLLLSTSAYALQPPPGGTGTLPKVGVPSSVLSAAQTSPLEGAQSAGLVPSEPEGYDWAAGEKEFAPPASAGVGPARAGVGAGALLAAGVAWGYRSDISTGLNSIWGVNAQQAVCSPGQRAANGAFQPLIAGVTGMDCSAAGAQTLPANSDQSSTTTGGPSCGTIPGAGTACLTLASTGSITVNIRGTDYPYLVYCMLLSGSAPSGTSAGYELYLGGTFVEGGLHTMGSRSGNDCPTGTSFELAFYGTTPTFDSYCIDFVGGSNDCAGSTSIVSQVAADPVRTLKCVVVTATGGVYEASTAGFLESNGVLPTPNCPTTPKGVVTTDTKIYEITPGQPDQLIADLPATSAYGNWAASAPSECLSGGCALDVLSADGTLDCNATPSNTLCAGWFTDPSRSTNWVCKYGATVEALSECNVLAHYYEPNALEDGSLFSDPATGDPEAGSSQKPGVLTPGTGLQDPTQDRPCFPNGWGALNPVNWVLEPVTCALQWAFVPRQSVLQGDVQSLEDDFDDSPPGKIKDFGATLVWPTPAGGGGGCSGITVDFSQFKSISASQGLGGLGGWNGNATFLNACPGDPLAPYAGWVSVILGAVFIFAGILATLRLAGQLFGYSGPGSGSGS